MSFKSLDAEMKKSFLVYGENNVMGNIMDSHDKISSWHLQMTAWVYLNGVQSKKVGIIRQG